VTWQTIQLLLGPEEHVGFLQNAVAQFDVKDPDTGAIFPKLLPKECLPNRPDDAMETWYEGVADRLRREAETEAVDQEKVPRRHAHVDEPGPRTSSEISEGSADERHAAAKYFSDPLYRKARPRPPLTRHYSRERPYEHERVGDRSKLISSVRHMLNPFNSRRKSLPPARDEDDYSDEDATPLAWAPPPAPRYTSHKRLVVAHRCSGNAALMSQRHRPESTSPLTTRNLPKNVATPTTRARLVQGGKRTVHLHSMGLPNHPFSQRTSRMPTSKQPNTTNVPDLPCLRLVRAIVPTSGIQPHLRRSISPTSVSGNEITNR
jgi:hypothetical protein